MSAWNPFEPTQRDVKRTEKLAKKNSTIAGILSLLFVPFAMLYLNRGINNLKICGYLIAVYFIMGTMVEVATYNKSDREFDQIAVGAGNVIGLVGGLAIAVENMRAVSLARKRKSQEDLNISES
ncbi:MAG: hypothetical protein AAF378_13520 [Cyanobacteria bacterium P01_A01_bin.84]